MAKLFKAMMGFLIVLGVFVLGASLWAMRGLDRYHALSPADRAKEDRQGQAASELARREKLKGTDCEHLDALSCYDMRRKRHNLEEMARAYENSDLKKAYDDAGVR